MAAAQTKREQLQQGRSMPSKKSIPQWVKVVLNIFFLLPVIGLFFYATGMWAVVVEDGKAIKDGWDSFIISFCVFSGLGGLILLNVLLNAYTEEE